MKHRDIIEKMSLKEKAYLVSGQSPWKVRGISQAGLSFIVLNDGPHGIRKPNDLDSHGVEGMEEAICFPTAVSTASSFNENLIHTMGEYLAEEMITMGVQILLGPGTNIKRSPLCGRNFEYFSEDPYHAGKMATAFINGVQSKGLGTSLKHYVANNQETRRMTTSAKVDERTLREIYLAAFEEPVKVAKPWTIMTSYNRINGVYASENTYLLRTILRDEWGFEGVILSDWGAVDELPQALKGGLDLEMPSSGPVGPKSVIKAVENRQLEESILDEAVDHLISLLKLGNTAATIEQANHYDKAQHHHYAREIARECIVLLKNEWNILPLQKSAKIALVGELAVKPRFQGGGSSKILPYKIDTLVDELQQFDMSVKYAQGYTIATDEVDVKLVNEAVQTVNESDLAVILVGLPDRYETEGSDRKHISMPPNQLDLMDELIKTGKKLVVIVTAGSVVKIPFADKVHAIIYSGLIGEAGAGALADTLIGLNNPSGKLAESFIKTEQDDPSYEHFPGDEREVIYEEGIFVGYRYHDKYNTDIQFPFGHGLSYSNFDYERIEFDNDKISPNDELIVKCTIKNTSDISGKEVVQLYIQELQPEVERPPKELKGFCKIELTAGQAIELRFTLNKRSFAYYNTELKDWYVKPGKFAVMIGSSSKDIRLQQNVELVADFVNSHEVTSELRYIDAVEPPATGQIHRNTRVGLLKQHHLGQHLYQIMLQEMSPFSTDENAEDDEVIFGEDTMREFVDNLPLRDLVSFSQGSTLSTEKLEQLIHYLNTTTEFVPEELQKLLS